MTPRKKATAKTPAPGRYALRYTPGTDLARRYPDPTITRWDDRAAADAIRRAMPNAEHVEIHDTRGDTA